MFVLSVFDVSFPFILHEVAVVNVAYKANNKINYHYSFVFWGMMSSWITIINKKKKF